MNHDDTSPNEASIYKAINKLHSVSKYDASFGILACNDPCQFEIALVDGTYVRFEAVATGKDVK